MAERMKHMELITDSFELMGRLSPKKYKETCLAILKYQRAIETGKWDTPIPASGDPDKDMYLNVICAHLQDKAQSWAKRVIKNQENANRRWDKEREKQKAEVDQADQAKSKAAKQDKAEAEEVKQDKPKSNGPMTFEQFENLAGRGVDDKKLRALYNDLEAANWIYHGFDLRKYHTKCTEHFKSEGRGWKCGMVAVIAYNAHPRYMEGKRRFDAICDLAIDQGWGGGLCSVCETMSKTQSYSIGGVRYEGHNYDSVEKFIDFLKNV